MSRLLVLRLSALGDVIHTIPAVSILRQAHPEIGWAVEAPYGELVEIVAGVTAIPVSLKRWSRQPLESRKAAGAAIRAIRGYDTSVDFQGLLKSAAIALISGAKTRYGFDKSAVREKPAAYFANRRVVVDTNAHVIDQNLRLAEAAVEVPPPRRHTAGEAPAAPPDWSKFPADPQNKLARFAGSIVLLPGAGRAEKQWPIARFRELAGLLGDRALAVWGPGEEELAMATGARMAPRTNLRELAFLLRSAALVIGGDTGPLHLADALGTKLIGLYGPTNPRRNGPYSQLDRCLSTYDSSRTMEAISVNDVMARIEGLS